MMLLSGSVKLYWLRGAGVTGGVAAGSAGSEPGGRAAAGDSLCTRASSAWAFRMAVRRLSRCLQGRGHLVALQVHPELGILCGIQGRRRGLQRLNFRAQPRLFLLHAAVALGLAFAGIGAHFGAVRHQGGQRDQAQVLRQLHHRYQHRSEICAATPPKLTNFAMLGSIPCRQHSEGHILLQFQGQAPG